MTETSIAPIAGSALKAQAIGRKTIAFWVAAGVLCYLIFVEAFQDLYEFATRSDSYYSHALLVPFVSAFFLWRDRKVLSQMPTSPSILGYPFILIACVIVVVGDLLGFRIFGQIAVLPLLVGLILVFLGPRHLLRMWFPLVFLLFMIPLPMSLTTAMTFRARMLATEGAVQLWQAFFLPMVRDGSYIDFAGDRLLVGDVCSGLRSLIALLALGAVMSYISRTKTWTRLLILVASGPVAVAANVFRIFLLCVVAYFWGSELASGWVHDVSGIMIYVMALALMLALEALLRKIAPVSEPENEGTG